MAVVRARLGVIAFAVAVYAVLGLWIAGGVLLAREAFHRGNSPPVDLEARCDGPNRPCLDVTPARVRGAEDGSIAFDTEAGVAYATLLDSDRLVPSRRVTLELWDGDVVSVVDLPTGRRYRTDQWAQGWSSNNDEPIALLAFALLMLALPFASLCLAVTTLVKSANRRLRARAATP